MAYRRLTDLRLVKEYCCKPEGIKCPIHNTCYNDEFQCRYWKQIFEKFGEEGFIVRQGNHWYKAKGGGGTDKEQIIIDGVDVGECGFLVIQKHCDIESDDIFKACYNKDCKYSICSENPDCLYKMYKRKEKECEELEANNIYLRDRTGKLERAIIRRNNQLDQLKAENEELKTKLDKFAEQEEEEIRSLNLNNKLDDILKSIEQAEVQMKNTKYKQALEEIEGLIQSTLDDFEEDDEEVQLSYCHNISLQILDIISKAKEEE